VFCDKFIVPETKIVLSRKCYDIWSSFYVVIHNNLFHISCVLASGFIEITSQNVNTRKHLKRRALIIMDVNYIYSFPKTASLDS